MKDAVERKTVIFDQQDPSMTRPEYSKVIKKKKISRGVAPWRLGQCRKVFSPHIFRITGICCTHPLLFVPEKATLISLVTKQERMYQGTKLGQRLGKVLKN